MKLKRFDASEHLDTPERQAAYISLALETGDPEEIRDALGLVARARGMAEIASAAKLNRESLYRALSGNGNPEFTTVVKVMKALGLRLSVAPAAAMPKSRKKRAA